MYCYFTFYKPSGVMSRNTPANLLLRHASSCSINCPRDSAFAADRSHLFKVSSSFCDPIVLTRLSGSASLSPMFSSKCRISSAFPLFRPIAMPSSLTYSSSAQHRFPCEKVHLVDSRMHTSYPSSVRRSTSSPSSIRKSSSQAFRPSSSTSKRMDVTAGSLLASMELS